MARMKLTQRAIEALAAPTASGQQELIWDTELKGFGIRISAVSAEKAFVVQGRIKGSGTKRRDTIGLYGVFKLEQAREVARERLRQMRLGEDPRAGGGDQTLQQWLDNYIASRKKLRASSADGYRRNVETHLRDWLSRPLREITSQMVEARHGEIAREIAEKTKAKKLDRSNRVMPPGAAAANAVFRTFRLIYNFAKARDGKLPPNPCSILRGNWFKSRRRKRLVTVEQLPSFWGGIALLENEVAADYVRFVLFTGMRRREAAGLRWEAINWATRTITIPAEENKGDEDFALPMSDVVFALLMARRKIGKATFVFPANSESGHIEEPKSHFAEIAAATGIQVSPHDCRRTFTTVAESCDLSPYVLKALINHRLPTDDGDTTGGYIILSQERIRQAAQVVADKLKALCGLTPAGENVKPLRAG